jgi:hypothetical protein
LFADVEDTAKADAGLRDRLVDPLVRVYTSSEIPLSLFSRHALIVGIAGLHLERHIRRYNSRVVTVALEEEELELRLFGYTLSNLLSEGGR